MAHSSSRVANSLGFLLLIVVSPLILAVLVLWLFAAMVLYILVWTLWCSRGKDILFVYSDSPDWHDYLEKHVLPEIRPRSVVLNWSDRRHWRLSLASLVFNVLGPRREFNPLAIYFRPLRRHRTFRFWRAFKDWKHGHPESLKRIENDFFDRIGLTRKYTE
jgi:hypothetical protein